MRTRGIRARFFTSVAISALALTVVAGAGGSPATGAGETLALVGMHWTSAGQPVGAQLYLVHADGSGLRRLSKAGPWSDDNPAWRADGRKLAFGRTTGRSWRLYVMDATGARTHAVTNGYSLADSPSWSPDGRSIAFEGLPLRLPPKGSLAQQVYIAAASGARVRQLTGFSVFKGGAGKPAWSPDGKRILFWGLRSNRGGVTSIWSVRPDGKRPYRLVYGATDPAWAPDSSRIAFVRRGDVYTARPDGKSARRVTRLRSEIADLSWSPDGMRIAFSLVHRAPNPVYDTQRTWIVRADGTGLHAVTAARPAFWTGAPAWKPG